MSFTVSKLEGAKCANLFQAWDEKLPYEALHGFGQLSCQLDAAIVIVIDNSAFFAYPMLTPAFWPTGLLDNLSGQETDR